jgi:hypothetical protein
MKHSEFWLRMDQHLGDTYARSWASSQVVGELDGKTVDEALAGGQSPKNVWRAVHAALRLPPSER